MSDTGTQPQADDVTHDDQFLTNDPVVAGDPQDDTALADAQSSEEKASTKAETKENPLDVLERLLGEIDQNKPDSKMSGENQAGAAKNDTSGPTQEEIAAQELEAKRVEYEKKLAEQKIIDDQLIARQREALEQEQYSATSMARNQQDTEKKEQSEQKKQAEDGFEIIQLGHTKI